MSSDILKQWQRKIVDESVTVVITCVIIVIILLNFVYHGFHCGTIVLTSYLTGIYFWKQATSSWFLLFTSCLDSNHVVTNTLEKNADEQKPRVLIPRSVDQALEQVFCRVLNQYISNWYRHLSSDASFQSEVRTAIQHAVTAICSRTAQIKIDQLLLCKIVPVILHHAIETRYEVFNLHVALHSRKSEIFYLQNLSKHLLKYLLPQSSLSCKLYTSLLREIISKSLLLQFSDTVCNPAVLNHLMLRCFDRKYSTNCFVEDETEDSDRVPLLQNFVNSRPMNPCYLSLRPTINDILKDEELRNTFMQHLKVYNTEYVLQFCLDVDSFNEKMLKPELDAEELDNLYKDAWDLFSVYFSKYSPNCIHFPRDLASSLRKALSKDVLKLRSTATLFEAYEYAFSLLEEYCQDFYKSAEFHHWLYGWYDKHSNDSVSLRNFCLRNVIESGHKFIKIKGVQKRNTNLEEPERNSVPQVEEMCINSQSHPVRKIDINRWKTTILAAKFKLVPDANKTISVLTIRTLDENNIEWLVERSLGDLRFMHSKLIEIHEENAKTPFPLSECFTIQPEHIPVYETYLNEVMKLSSVTSSQILYKFLTSAEYANDEVGGGVNSKYEEYNNVGGEKNEKDADAEEKEEEKDEEEGEEEYNEEEEEEEEKEEEGEEEAEMRFDKLFPKFTAQSPSLRKERGQNLETFVNSVILSCLPRKCDYDDVGENKPENKIHLKANGNHLNENMFNVDADTTVKIIYDNKPAKYSGKRFCSPFTLVIYVAFKIYRVRVCITKFIMTWKSAFGMIVDQFIFNVTNVFLNLFTKTCNPSYFINTVEWAVFDNDIKFNDEEMKDRMMKLLFDTKDDWLHPVYNLIFENLQDSKRNKQLFYNLADILAEELFPEMFTAAVESAIQ